MKKVASDIKIIQGNSTDANRICSEESGRIALAVTSPPYHNAIDYESHSTNSESNYRPRQGLDYAAEYLPLMKAVWDETWTMLKPGGYLAINVGSVLENGFHYPLPQDITLQLCSSEPKWEYFQSIIWHKVTAGVKRAGSVIKHQLPGYWYPNIMTEHIIIVRKPGNPLKTNSDVPAEWWENVWDLAPVPPRSIDHPAPFPEDIPHRLIRMLTQPGDWIFDPFNGAGSTTKAAFDLGRSAIGLDLEPKYIKTALSRLDAGSTVRSSQLRIVPISSEDFTPGKSRGTTRHGAGLKTRKGTDK